MKPESKYYAVSTGNGNDGVSRLFPDYIVKTDDPWRLASLAVAHEFNDERWALENADIDGEPEYGISACIYEGPNGETQLGAAYFIAEIYEADGAVSDRSSAPEYESLEDCFPEHLLELVPVCA